MFYVATMETGKKTGPGWLNELGSWII
jgi:hypothetical protein